jgi:uncharacterized protein YndB with AHSA1/START domain
MAEVEVTVEIDAPAAKVWELVSDPTRMGDWSPECLSVTWSPGSTGAAIGARFAGTNKIGWRRWTTSGTITVFEPGVAVGWDVRFGPIDVSHWSYVVTALPGDDEHCSLTETFVDYRHPLIAALSPVVRGVSDTESHNRQGMETTLERIKAEAELTAQS